MPSAFDPYYTWLAIPPEEQPPDHYRLLGLRKLEENPDVIQNAADQRMAHLRTFQTGKHAELSQKMLNEVAAAKVCLLNPTKKAAYDQQLRAKIEAESPKEAPQEPAGEISVNLGRFLKQVEAEKRAPRPPTLPDEPQPRRKFPFRGVASIVAATALLVLVGWTLTSLISGKGPAATEAVLVFDWPDEQRQHVALMIDRDRVKLPPSGRVEHRCKPGEHRIRAKRPGFRIYEEFVTLKAGEEKEIVVTWLPQSHLILQWPLRERRKSRLEIDGRSQDVSVVATHVGQRHIEIPIDAGPHKIRIDREGFDPFEQRIMVVEGKDYNISPSWRKRVGELGQQQPEQDHEPDREPPGPEPPPVAEHPQESEPPAVAKKKSPVPPASVRDEISKQLKEVYAIEKAETPAAKIKLANDLFQLNAEYREKPNEQFVLLSTAMRLASEGGDAQLMLKVIDAVGDDFDVDVLGAKVKMLATFAADANSSATFKTLVESSEAVINRAMAEERFDLAENLADGVYRTCMKKSSGKSFRKQAHNRRTDVQKLREDWQEVQENLSKLKTNPNDAEANQTVAEWYCLVSAEWDRGLPYLAKGSDEQLRALARQELDTPPTEAADQVKLADAWWDHAQSRKGLQKDSVLLHAGHWYQEAKPNIDSTLLEKKLAQRMEVIDKTEHPFATAREEPISETDFASGNWVDLLKWINTERDRVEGDWKRDADTITGWSKHAARILLPVVVEGSYDLKVDFTRTAGDDHVAITFPVQMRRCCLLFSAWHGEVSGLDGIDGRNARDYPANKRPGTLVSGQRYSVVVSVRPEGDSGRIEVALDGQPYIQWAGRLDSLRFRENVFSELRQPRFGCYDAQVVLHAAELRLISGRASLTTSASEQAGVAQPQRRQPGQPATADVVRDLRKLTPGDPLSRKAVVAKPASIPGARSWTIETTGHRGEVRSLAYSPDGNMLATGAEDGTIRLWDASDDKLLKALVGHDDSVYSLTFSPDGKLLASAGADKVIRLWHVNSGLVEQTLLGHGEAVNSVAFSPDGRLLASGSSDRTIGLWEVNTGRQTGALQEHSSNEVSCVAFSPDGKTLASAGNNRDIRLWDPTSGQQLRTMGMDNGEWGTVLAWLPDGKTLVSCRARGSIHVWDVQSGQLRRKLGDSLGQFVCSPDGKTVLAAGTWRDQKMRLWDTKTGKLIEEHDKPQGVVGITAMAYSPDGNTLAASNARYVQIVRKTRSGLKPELLPTHPGQVLYADFSPSGKALACGSRDWTGRVFDIPSGRLLREVHPTYGPDSFVRLVRWSPDSSKLVTCVPHGLPNEPDRLHVWDVRSGRLLSEFRVDWQPMPDVEWFPQGMMLVYASGRTQVWDAASGKKVREIDYNSRALAFSSDGKALALQGPNSEEIRIFSPRSGQILRTIQVHRSEGRSGAVAFSPNGKTLASAAQRNTVCLSDTQTGQFLGTLQGVHQSEVRRLDWLGDNKTLASGSNTETCVWDTQSQQLLRTIPDDGGAFSPDDQLLASRGSSMVRLRTLSDGDLVRSILSLAGQQYIVVGPEGHWRGSRTAKKDLVYVVQTDQGQETLTPDTFARKYDRKNDPKQVP